MTDSTFFFCREVDLNLSLNRKSPIHQTKKSRAGHSDSESSYNWNVSNVRDMGGMFEGLKQFNLPLNKWDVSNVTDMSYMFRDARSFNQPLSDWNVSNVRRMRRMFKDATSFNQPRHAPWYHEESVLLNSSWWTDSDSDSE